MKVTVTVEIQDTIGEFETDSIEYAMAKLDVIRHQPSMLPNLCRRVYKVVKESGVEEQTKG